MNINKYKEYYKKKNKKKIKHLKKKVILLKDKNLRYLAEFENYKKRNEKEKENILKKNLADTIKKILPVLDDFDRYIKEEKIKEHDGIYLIYKNFKKILKDNGIKKIKVKIGDDFNYDLHYAISQEKNNEMKNKIVKILEEGYYIHDQILRSTKVIVGS